MKRTRGIFRGKCCAAKLRLGGGFWTEAQAERVAGIERAETLGTNRAEVVNTFMSQLKNTVQRHHENNKDDEQLYNRVRALLSGAPNSNPLASVLDRDYMRTLESAERERYVFNLSAKVQHCIERFNYEQELDIKAL